MTETCPRSGLSDISVFKAGIGVFGRSLNGVTGSRFEGSNTLPVINGTGNVFGLDMKSSCPKFQKSMIRVNRLTVTRKVSETPF